MDSKLKMALAMAGSPDLATVQTLTENGCPLSAIKTCPTLLVKASTGAHLSSEELSTLAKAGADVAKLLGIRSPSLLASVAAPDATPLPAPVEVLVPIGKDEAGNAVSQIVTLEGDPFAFILKTKISLSADAIKQRKALTTLYNSFTGRAQSKIVEGYRNGLKILGVEIAKETMSEATAEARKAMTIDRMMDGVLSKKGFTVSHEEQQKGLIDGLRANLISRGVTISDQQHNECLEHGKSVALDFTKTVVAGLSKRKIGFRG